MRQNIARYKALLKEEERECDRRILKELLAGALRQQAILEAQHEGLQPEIGLTQAAVPRLIFRNEFMASPEPHLLLDPRKGLHIVDINDAYGLATMTSSAKIAGNPLFDVFPDNPAYATADGVSNLFASLKRVTETGAVDAMPIQHYDVRDPDGVFVTKFWKPVNRPIFDGEGRLVYLLHHVQDVTGILAAQLPNSPSCASVGVTPCTDHR